MIPVFNAEFAIVRNVGDWSLRLATGASGTADDVARRFAAPWHYLITGVLAATAVTVVWSLVDRRRLEYLTLNRALRVYARYTLALVMLNYAMVKVVPTQFGFLTPGELLRPVGQLNRFWVLWNFMVVSTGYTVFTGLVELAGCVLLFFRRTTLLGALLLAGALTNIFAINVAYRVLGALTATGMLLTLAAIVIAPYLPSLAGLFVHGRSGQLPVEPAPVVLRQQFMPAVKILMLSLLIAVRASDGLAQRRTYAGQGQAIYGLFDVDRFVRDGSVIIPLASDGTTWRRVASDGRYDGQGLSVQFANGDVREYRLTDNVAARTWTLREGNTVFATLQYALDDDRSVTLDGTIGTDRVQVHLKPVDLGTLPLLRQP